MEHYKTLIKNAVQDKYAVEVDLTISRPDPQFGDIATSVAMQLAGRLDKKPRDIAQELALLLENVEDFERVIVAGPGFINIHISGAAIQRALITVISEREHYGTNDALRGKTIVAEYSDPNPFKVLHAGHLYTSIVGDAIANLLKVASAEVHRINFGGDVGLHVGKTLWAIVQKLGGEYPEKLNDVAPQERSEWMAAAYIEGTNKYNEDESTKESMITLNKKVYDFHANNERTSPLSQIYWTCRQWSYKYFEQFYKRIGTVFERYIPESEVANLGLNTVRAHVGDVFTQSDGAVVFRGEAYGLHTRVFITKEGLPTYEAKDVGLMMRKWQDYHFDKSIVITGNEQEQYMAVVLKAIEQFAPEMSHATSHIPHGIVKLQGGVKMSSRKGNILRAGDVLDAASEANKRATGKDDEQVVLGAVKYSFLKQRTGGDIIYDPVESVSIHGNSGPYLQYGLVRAKSMLRKSSVASFSNLSIELNPSERMLALKVIEYPEVVIKAQRELMPHHIAVYLYELAQVFNRFYENNRVIGDESEAKRIHLVGAYTIALENGLRLLGIPILEHM